MNFEEYIKPELLILIPVLYLVGIAIKKSNVKDKYIPWILGGCSVLLAAIYIFASETMDSFQSIAIAIFTAVTQGVLIAGASVYVNQLVKQTKE